VNQTVTEAESIAIRSDADIVEARRRMRDLASPLALMGSEITMLATAVSELARNILRYAREGEIALDLIERNGQAGLQIVARDKGPGIENIELAMRDGFSTSAGLGLGLPGSKRLVDEFEIDSQVGVGTTVTLKKWALAQ
jgi:serine/threonine-protein kinase RsbT